MAPTIKFTVAGGKATAKRTDPTKKCPVCNRQKGVAEYQDPNGQEVYSACAKCRDREMDAYEWVYRPDRYYIDKGAKGKGGMPAPEIHVIGCGHAIM